MPANPTSVVNNSVIMLPYSCLGLVLVGDGVTPVYLCVRGLCMLL